MACWLPATATRSRSTNSCPDKQNREEKRCRHSTQDYLNLSNAAYTTDGAQPTAPTGWTLIDFQPATSANGGMQAAAFQNAAGEIVIAYEGTNLASLSTLVPQLGSDGAITEGNAPVANGQALSFAQSVAAAHQNSPVYVTGHSLGGEEAEYVQAFAATNNLNISGGAAFGGPGVPDLSASQAATFANQFTTYVDYGDGFGSFVAGDGAQVGTIASVGNPADPSLEQYLLDTGPDAGGAGAALLMMAQDHSLVNYAADLGYTLSGSPSATTEGTPDLLESINTCGIIPFGNWPPGGTPQVQNGTLSIGDDTLTDADGVAQFAFVDPDTGVSSSGELVPAGDTGDAGGSTDAALVGGNGATLDGGSGNDVLLMLGDDGIVNGGTGSTQVLIDGTNNVVNASDATVTGEDGASFAVDGYSNDVYLSNDSTLSFTGGYGNWAGGQAGDTITVGGNGQWGYDANPATAPI